MEPKPEYIAFIIGEEKKFNRMSELYALIAEAKNSQQPKPVEFWLSAFPGYSKEHFIFPTGRDHASAGHGSGRHTQWSFEGMVELLQSDLDVEYLGCERSGTHGRIEFLANGYPYGGITGLILFLNAFDCRAHEVDEGAGVYAVHWRSELEFELVPMC